MFVKQTRNRL